jgi:hypothetical protein
MNTMILMHTLQPHEMATKSKIVETKISDLSVFDVLCGRGKQSYNNIGNRRFRIMININLQKYLKCESRTDRSKMILGLTYDLQRSFRFLKPIKAEGEKNCCSALVALDLTETRVKIAHALRDAAAQHKIMERKEKRERNKAANIQNAVNHVDNNVNRNSAQPVYPDPPRLSIERKADNHLMAATRRNVLDHADTSGKSNNDQRVCHDPPRLLATSRNVVDHVNHNGKHDSEQSRLSPLLFQDGPAGEEELDLASDLTEIFD